MILLSLEPESSASAYSATSAYLVVVLIYFSSVKISEDGEAALRVTLAVNEIYYGTACR